jgi:hypothetical protein
VEGLINEGLLDMCTHTAYHNIPLIDIYRIFIVPPPQMFPLRYVVQVKSFLLGMFSLSSSNCSTLLIFKHCSGWSDVPARACMYVASLSSLVCTYIHFSLSSQARVQVALFCSGRSTCAQQK